MNHFSRLLIFLCLTLTACITQPQASQNAQFSTGPAEVTISAVEVLRIATDTSDVRVVVRGTLPDSCAQLREPALERSGRLFSVTVDAVRTAAGACSPGPLQFERVVRLVLSADSGPVDGRFGVLVNGVQQYFEIRADNLQMPVAVSGGGAQAQTEVAPVSIASTPEATTTSLPETAIPQTASTDQPAAEATPTEQAITLGPSTGPADCVNKAAIFEDVTISTANSVDPGSSFVKTWKVRNEGTCTWGQGYQLVLVDGDPLGTNGVIALTPAAPNEVVQISVPMTAPTIPGLYQSKWGFATPQGQSFGVGSAGLYPLEMKVGVRQLPVEGVGCEYQFSSEEELKILEYINAERALNGLPPHVMDEKLSTVARAHSIERGCLGNHSHFGADGKNYETRVKRAEIPYRWVSEIIYTGNYGAKWAVNWWVYKSKLHHDIVMSSKYSTIGVGYVKTNRGEYGDYFTVLLIAPP